MLKDLMDYFFRQGVLSAVSLLLRGSSKGNRMLPAPAWNWIHLFLILFPQVLDPLPFKTVSDLHVIPKNFVSDAIFQLGKLVTAVFFHLHRLHIPSLVNSLPSGRISDLSSCWALRRWDWGICAQTRSGPHLPCTLQAVFPKDKTSHTFKPTLRLLALLSSNISWTKFLMPQSR